jgi:tripartite-type tricarboxylate transporter receptor subunit TctC
MSATGGAFGGGRCHCDEAGDKTIPGRSATLATALLVCACVALPAAGAEQKYPERPIRLIVQSPAGGTADLIARVIGQKLGEALGQPVVADNRDGAAGTISAEITARAAPDGYTLLVASVSLMAINVTLRAGKLSYHPEKDFTHIALTGKVPLALAVLPAFPAKSVKELIALARARPGSINYGSAGVGSSNHITGELIKTEAGIDMSHVPFKGGAPAMAALLANQIELYIATVPTIMPMVNAGRIRALGVSSARRSSALPDVPTIAESAIPGFDVTSWFCIVGPAGIPKPIVARLNKEIVAALNTSDVRQKLTAAGVNVEPTTPEGLSAFVHQEIQKMGKAVRAGGAKID